MADDIYLHKSTASMVFESELTNEKWGHLQQQQDSCLVDPQTKAGWHLWWGLRRTSTHASKYYLRKGEHTILALWRSGIVGFRGLVRPGWYICRSNEGEIDLALWTSWSIRLDIPIRIHLKWLWSTETKISNPIGKSEMTQMWRWAKRDSLTAARHKGCPKT